MFKLGRLVILFLLTIVMGVVLAKAAERYTELQVFSKVLNFVQRYYVEDVDTKKLVYGAIKGMLEELDPHTNFLPPDLYKEFKSETSGEFGGVGIEITNQDGNLTVIAPIEDTPAWKAGILAGDKIISINGEPTKGLSLVEAAQKMKGETGEKITLGISRANKKEALVFTIKRAKLKTQSVKYTDMDDGYAYIKLTSFIQKSGDDLKESLEKHKKRHKEIKGLILDLRNNPGGLLDQAVQVSNLFLKEGIIVSTRGRDGKKEEIIRAGEAGTLEDFPIIVLVNEYSASASEILAGALQDNQRAVVMGRRSFGKGSVQSVIELEDGSALKLTVARYFTPSGSSIQAKGIVPDIVVEKFNPEAYKEAVNRQKVKREGDIKGALKAEKTSQAAFWTDKDKSNLSPNEQILSEDFEVLQAFNYLKAWKVFKNQKPGK
jgi:carboxyl-terminal processing protease